MTKPIEQDFGKFLGVEKPQVHVDPSRVIERARSILGKILKVFDEYQFPEQGIVLTKQGPKVPVYLANGEAFKYPGNYFLQNYLYPKIERINGFVLDPFALCKEFLSEPHWNKNHSQHQSAWKEFYKVLPIVNYQLTLPISGAVFSPAEGASLDEGMSSEWADAVKSYGIPVFAARTDIRQCEYLSGANRAVTYFASNPEFGGSYHEIPNPDSDQAYLEALGDLKKFIDQKLKTFRSV